MNRRHHSLPPEEKEQRNRQAVSEISALAAQVTDLWCKAEFRQAELVGFSASSDRAYRKNSDASLPLELRAHPEWSAHKQLEVCDRDTSANLKISTVFALVKVLNESLKLAYTDFLSGFSEENPRKKEIIPRAGYDRRSREVVIQFPPGANAETCRKGLTDRADEIKSHIRDALVTDHIYRTFNSHDLDALLSDHFMPG